MTRKSIFIYDGSSSIKNHIALGFHDIGYTVAYAFGDDHSLQAIVSSGRRYDILLSTQPKVDRLVRIFEMNSTIRWRDFFPCIVMLQFHDIVQEISPIMKAQAALAPLGISLVYWTYCRSTKRFMDTTNIYPNHFFEVLPLVRDRDVIDRRIFIDELGPHIVGPPPEAIPSGVTDPPAEGSAAAVYFGQCDFPSAYQPLMAFPPDTPFSADDLTRALDEYLSQRFSAGRSIDRVGFIEHLLACGLLSPHDLSTPLPSRCINIFAALVVQEIRRKFCLALRRRHGPKFLLFGDDWSRIGLDSLPKQTAMRRHYAGALVSVDFGSLFLDAPMYTRTHDILSLGGRLLQFRQPNSGEHYGEHRELACFDNADSLLERIDRAMADPEGFCRSHMDFTRRLDDLCHAATVCRRVEAHVATVCRRVEAHVAGLQARP